MQDGLVWNETLHKYVFADDNAITEAHRVTPLIVRKAQNVPEQLPTGYAVSEIVYTTSS